MSTSPTLQTADLLNNLRQLFQETFLGTGGQASMYIDGKGHGSLFETLDATAASVASTALVPGGATIAAHAEHLRYYLEVIPRFMRGEHDVQADWAGSWATRAVDDKQWRNLKAALRKQYDQTLAYFDTIECWDDGPVGGSMGLLAHSAYHLGAIRLLSVTLPATALSSGLK